MEETLGRDAVRLAAAAEAVQDALGGHRDLVLLAAHVRSGTAGTKLSPPAKAEITRLASECEASAAKRIEQLPALLDAVRDAS